MAADKIYGLITASSQTDGAAGLQLDPFAPVFRVSTETGRLNPEAAPYLVDTAWSSWRCRTDGSASEAGTRPSPSPSGGPRRPPPPWNAAQNRETSHPLRHVVTVRDAFRFLPKETRAKGYWIPSTIGLLSRRSKVSPLGRPRSSPTRTERSVPSMLDISIFGPSRFQSAQKICLLTRTHQNPPEPTRTHQNPTS
ncbi:hypothetical protein EYF80_057275 [Liparis tanakae]|uniref:Uncharacterized protein n=1 Tax=Liparis tanakae TaxID=230148 RepID=A0A4Z2EUV8_9TELE|nr:hypothetical protein EYF80_057275 [Liparis tanakae]